MRHFKIMAVAVLITSLLYGCTDRSEAQGPPPAPEVSVATPLVDQVVDWDEFTGRFEAPQSVDVRARVGGYIQAVHFRDGQFVRKGQLLFTLDARPALAALASARAQAAQAEAQVALARSELARAESLLEIQAVSQAEVDQKRAAVQTAEAAVASARAAVRGRELDVEFTRVTAPISGRVSDRRVDAGNLVGGGSSAADVLTTIVASSPIHFVFEASEAVMLRYQRDARDGTSAPIRIRLQDETGFRWSGTVDFSDNVVDPASGTIRLRAVVQNGDGFLKPGLFGQARVAGAAPYQALLVPDAAVATDQARRVVYVVDAENMVVARPVELGPLSDGLRVIRSGIEPTDRVIVNGQLRARPGQPVTPKTVEIARTPTDTQAPVTRAPPAATATPAGALSQRR
ncbi:MULTISPECIES: efflux RND transporter periplasmic adaptor subunit [unclassified Brevundimonas]|jgi:RND family efflux transporter MFP subunit|uniref:efflux RND transporter periplasmic adaptor subunit n=1 Tax=unclassified Brevundimonas TaxID=2622653 RepID=UPI000C5412C7|nr:MULTISPECIES: efflux RND transporter periplasmic adaptor subunit [unclassified Brevundimonas]MAL87879.1 efflux transporter periplasmic adaptor subunit [Brevundimonas sp.]|tara:strand:- start:48242 stop:49444 length:1203 start_codon:yes stop_codon:yes gene_type:complete